MAIQNEIQETFHKTNNKITRYLKVGEWNGESSIETSNQSDNLAESFEYGVLTEDTIYATPTDKLRIADVFCGAGGLSVGVSHALKSTGIEPVHVLASDIDDKVLSVYAHNFQPQHLIDQDITKFANGNCPEELYKSIGNVDILVGGPPCPPFSIMNHISRDEDPRSSLYLLMPILAKLLNAKIVIVENVPTLVKDKRGILPKAKKVFNEFGYILDDAIIFAHELGVSQIRKRHILIASNMQKPNLQVTVDTFTRRPYRPVRWAIEDLEHIKDTTNMDLPSIQGHLSKSRIDWLFDNDEYDLPNALMHKTVHSGAAGRMYYDRLAGTLTTKFLTMECGRFTHPTQRRTISNREAARIQGFPDSFEFIGQSRDYPARKHIAEMIGNAVPPAVGFVATIAALASIHKESKKYE